jgi:hypothetical protein
MRKEKFSHIHIVGQQDAKPRYVRWLCAIGFLVILLALLFVSLG